MEILQTEIVVSVDGAESARWVVAPGDYILGRNADCELRVEAELVSRKHARLTVQDDVVLVEDLGSSNGTFVNGERVTGSSRVAPSQKIQVGKATVELHRIKTMPPPDVSLSPGAVRELLPEEFLREKKYDIGGVVARGGMGAILNAREATIERSVAMKVMLGSSSSDDLARFIAEAKITGQLEHPNIVPVHELGVDERGQVFYTMKLVRGITLRKVLELLAEGAEGTVKKYPLVQLLTVFQKVCDAVAFAHNKSVIHRDLKPENIMIGDFGEVLLMDWGLAKLLGAAPTMRVAPGAPVRSSVHHASIGSTLDGTIMGTPHYMSPEQARGEIDTLDARTDIYALGAILYHLLALRSSVSGKSAAEIVDKVAQGNIEPLVAASSKKTPTKAKVLPHIPGGRIPDGLAAVVRKAMAFEKEQRYPNVAALQNDIAAFQGGFTTSAEEKSRWKELTLLVRRNKAASIGVAAVLLTALVFGGKAVVEGQHAKREAARASQALVELRKTAPTFAAQAQALVEQHAFDEALATLATACSLDPFKAEYRLQQGHILQTMQRYAEAEAAYREALQREPALEAATRNLAFTKSLASEAAQGPEQAKRAQARLQTELLRQERSAEAVFLSKDLSGDGARNIETWKPIVKKLGIKTDTKHLRPLPDGTLLLYIDDRTFSDLRPLHGMPLGELNMSFTAVQDLSPLQGAPLSRFKASGSTQLSDISALSGLPLREIDLTGTKVTDLGPLRGMKLVELKCTNLGQVTDLSPLAGMPLEKLLITIGGEADPSVLAGVPFRELSIYGELKSGLDFLRGAPLTQLRVESRRISDLSPLAGMPLTHLSIVNARLSDLAPLRGLPLRSLALSRCVLTDLSPIAGMSLQVLHLDDCKGLKDLSPIATLSSLEDLALPKGTYDLTPLRKLPKLKRVGYRLTINLQSTQTAEEFWAEYDVQQKSGGNQ